MAGMLPGVESARRRRFHGGSTSSSWWSDSPVSSSASSGSSNSSRRSSFCLYTSNNNSLITSNFNSHLLQRSMVNYQEDEKMGGVAREAKERLDERLRAQYRKLEPKRRNSQEIVRGLDDGRSTAMVMARDLQRDQDQVQSPTVLKKSGSSKRFMNWAKLRSWKSSEQDECAVCLEQFRGGETLAHLPCAHRFHSRCLLPWLENNAHCPCCRLAI